MECLRGDPERKRTIEAPASKGMRQMLQQIETLESQLRGVYPVGGHEQRPLSARSAAPRYYSPRRAEQARTPASPRYTSGSGGRRPLSSIGAYRQAGLNPQAWPLSPRATSVIEHWRSAPKYEEQMLLGHLRSERERLRPPPAWKLKQFEKVRPRV
jgi:hypothetical protein